MLSNPYGAVDGEGPDADLAGTQGTEILNWLITRAALTGRVSKVHRHYHIPISNTAAGVLVLANAA